MDVCRRHQPLVVIALAAAAAGCVDLSVPLDDAGQPVMPGPQPDADRPTPPPPMDALSDPEPPDVPTMPPAPDASTLGNGLVAYWPLNEKQGPRFEDRTGLAGPGWALEGAAWLTANLPAALGPTDVGALRFGGVNAFATIGVQGLPANGDVRTIALWFNLGEDATRQQEFISLTDGTGTALNLGVRSGLVVAVGWGGAVLASTTAPAAGGWHHLAYSYDKQLNRLYLDGKLQAQGMATPQQGPVREGWLASGRGRTDFFNGGLDDIRIFDRALDNTEISALAAGADAPSTDRPPPPMPPPIRNLVGYWKLDEPDAASPFADASGSGFAAKAVRGPQPSTSVPKLSFQNTHSLTFTGNQCATIGNPAALNFSGAISLSAWVNISTRTGTRDVIVHGPGTTETGLRLDAEAYVAYAWTGTALHRATFPVPGEDVGAWVHLAGVYDGTGWRLYRNGAQLSVTTDIVGARLVNGNWSIGGDGACADNFFRGNIDDVRIYHGSLTGAEVARIAAGTD